MVIPNSNLSQDLIGALEELMVKQFRGLQVFIKLSRQERQILTRGESEGLLPLVEEKGAILDQLGVLDDSRHMLMAEIAQSLNVNVDTLKIADLLQKIDPATAKRIGRLSEGILSLSDEVRELNLGNRALALTALDWLDATQKYLLSFYASPETYDAFGRKPGGPTHYLLRDIDQRT